MIGTNGGLASPQDEIIDKPENIEAQPVTGDGSDAQQQPSDKGVVEAKATTDVEEVGGKEPKVVVIRGMAVLVYE